MLLPELFSASSVFFSSSGFPFSISAGASTISETSEETCMISVSVVSEAVSASVFFVSVSGASTFSAACIASLFSETFVSVLSVPPILPIPTARTTATATAAAPYAHFGWIFLSPEASPSGVLPKSCILCLNTSFRLFFVSFEAV